MSFHPVKPREYGSTKAIVGALFDAAGGAKRAAFLLGRGLSQTYGYADEQVPEAQLSFEAVRRLTVASGATVAAEALAGDAGGFFTSVAPSEDTLAELMAREETAHGAMMADLMRRTGRLDTASSDERRLARDLDVVISALVAARQKVPT